MLFFANFSHKYENFNQTAIVVSNIELIPAITVEVSPCERADRALLFFDGVAHVGEVGGISRGQQVRGVVTVTSHHDVRGCVALGWNLWPEGVREARSHVRNCNTKFILEAGRDGASCEITSHPVCGEVIGPDAIISVWLLVIVHKQLFHSVVVDVDVSYWVRTSNIFWVNFTTCN